MVRFPCRNAAFSAPLFVSFVLFVVSPVLAGTPRLARVTPPGGQKGTTVEVEFTGRNLDQPREVLFYEPGITVESIKAVESIVGANGKAVPVDPGTRVRARLKLAEDCPLGLHGLRLRTRDGLSEYHRFSVGPFPIVEENEVNTKRNDKRENAMAVAVNTTVLRPTQRSRGRR